MKGEQNSLAISYNLDVGRTNSFFTNSREAARNAFEETVPNCSEGGSYHMGLPEGTTLTIAIAMFSAGAGVVATEFLKELGKELWNAVRRLILPNKERKEESKDKFVIELHIGEVSVIASLSDLGSRNEIEIKHFIEKTLPRLFMECAKKIEKE